MTSDTGTRERIYLAGTWHLAFDPDGEGARNGWATDRWPDDRAIAVQVPSLWNLTHPDYSGAGYYRTVVNLPGQWDGRVIRLHIGGASYRTEAWLNGHFLGSHEGAYTAFAFDVTAAARPGAANEIVIRVTSLSRTAPIDGMVLKEMPVSKQSWYYAEGGLWGDVWLDAVPRLHCDSIAVEPDLRQELARIEVRIVNAGPEIRHVTLDLSATGPHGDEVAAWRDPIAAPPGTSTYLIETKLPRPLAWSCEEPNLYRARVRLLKDAAVVDEHAATFGMRDFTVKNGEYFLNGNPIYVKGILLQPNYPVGLIAPCDPGLIEREVLLAKEAGFNLIRIHIRPSVPGFFDLTDRHGMLVYAESSLCWILDTPRLLDHGRREVTAMIERDRNHPSVVFWGIFNEHRAPAARYAGDLIRTARALDPTRVIVDNSGGTLAMDQDFGWADRATVVPNRETRRVPLHDVHLYIGAPLTRAACDWLRTIGTKPAVDITGLGFGSPAIFDEWYRELRSDPSQVLVSELGCGGMSDLDETVAGFEGRHDLLDAREFVAFRDSLHEGMAARRLDRCFDSIADLTRAAQTQQATGNRREIEAVLTNRRTSGYILTQLNDVGSEFHAGIVDLWRRPKATFHDLKRLNRDRVLILFGSRAVATLGETVDVSLTVVDRLASPGGERVSITVSDPAGNVIATDEREIPPGQGIKELGVIPIATGSVTGEYRVIARIVGDDEDLMTTTESVLALPTVDPYEHPTTVLVAAEPASLSVADWQSFFAAVESGATSIVGPLRPGDTTAIGALTDRGIPIALHFGLGNWMGCYHWQPPSDLFAGLPNRGLAGEAYADVLPRYILTELGGEMLAGSFRNTETRHDVAKMLWFSDIETIEHGRGRLIFCQYRIFTEPGRDPLADRMRLNLLRVASAGVPA